MNTIDSLKTQLTMKLKRQTAAIQITTQQLDDLETLLKNSKK